VGIRVVRGYDRPREAGGTRVRPRLAGVLLLVMTPVLVCYTVVSGWVAATRAQAIGESAPLTDLADIGNAGWGLVSVLVALGCVALGFALITRGLSRAAAATLGMTYVGAGVVLGALTLILVLALLVVDPRAGVGWVVAGFGALVGFACTVFGWNLSVANRALCLLISGPAGVGRDVRLGPGWRTVVLVGPESTDRARVVISSAGAVAKTMVRVDRLTRNPFLPRTLVCRAEESAYRPTMAALAWGSPVIVVDVSTPTDRLVEDLETLGGWRGGRGRNSVIVCTQATAEAYLATQSDDTSPTARVAALLDGRDVLVYGGPAQRREFAESLRNRAEAVLMAPSRVATIVATTFSADASGAAADGEDGT